MKNTKGTGKCEMMEITEKTKGWWVISRKGVTIYNARNKQDAEQTLREWQSAPEGLKTAESVYLKLQILANKSVGFAIATDKIRASLRNYISEATGKTGQEVQEKCEQKAFKEHDSNS